ncbi:MAG: hypothetical protein ACFE75_07715 [Candidatus Hodarchaeota archaeon]
MKDRVKNISLILAIVIAGISLPTSIVSFMDPPTTPIIEIYNYYYNNTIIEKYNQTIIEQSNYTGKHIIQPITYLPALNSGATLEGIWIDLNAIGEYMYATFFANSDVVDTSEDVIFRFIMNCQQTDPSLEMLKYGAHTATDNTTTFSWNIDIDVAISFNTTAIVMFIYEYIFDAVDVEDNDWLSFALKLNEASRRVGIMYAEVEYIHV